MKGRITTIYTSLLLPFGVLMTVGLIGAPPPNATTGNWTKIATSAMGRSGACAAALADGRILITGGLGLAGSLTSAEIAGQDGAVANVAPMSAARSRHSCTPLADGRVLVAGGVSDSAIMSAAEIYDPGLNRWLSAGQMVAPRMGHTATRLNDGRILIAGGEGPNTVHNTLEVFDPAANNFVSHSDGLLSSARKEHVAALLGDGRVLIAGGTDGSTALASTDVYDPATDTLTAGPQMAVARAGATATVVWDGGVLIAGGNSEGTAEVYDPVAGKFSETGKMTTPRHGHIAFELPNNHQVLLVGGDATGASAELFAPWRGTFKSTGGLDQSRTDAVGGPIGSDGLAFVAGGSSRGGRGAALDSAAVYRFATLKTDSETYEPGASAVLSGSGWQPGEKVSILIQERSREQADSRLTANADGSGNFEVQFQTAPLRDLHYSFTATGANAEVIARASTGEAANLNQCADGAGLAFPLASSNNGCTGGWQNGNMNGSKATYFEGDSLPYQTVITGLVADGKTVHTITIQWDTTQGTDHAIDYITTYNRSVTNANECQGVANCNATSTTMAIPPDPRMVAAGVTPIPGNFTMFGGTITGVSAYSYVGPGDYSTSTSAGLSVSFTASNSTVVLAWGGHIATHVDWPGLSAVNLTGSPFHTRLQGLDGASVGNQDRALALSAAIFPFTLQLTKTFSGASAPGAGFQFGINSTGSLGTLTNPLFLCGSNPCSANSGSIFPAAGSTTFASYTIAETVPTGWNTPTSVCSTSGGASGTNNNFASDGTTVSFTPKQGDNVVCTYTNTASSSTVTLNKTVTPANDTGSFNLSIMPGGPGCSMTVTPSGSVSCSEVFSTSVTVGETGAGGTVLSSYNSTLSCSGATLTGTTTSGSFTMPNNAVNCTLSNTRHQYLVTLKKTTVPSGDTGTFALQISGCASGSNATGTKRNGESISCSVYGGQQVTVSESGANLTNYNSALSCDVVSPSGTTTSGSFTMPDGAVNCTLTNTRKAHSVTLTKAIVPTTDAGVFGLSIGDNGGTQATVGNVPSNGSMSISRSVAGGLTVTVAETSASTGLSNYTYQSVCTYQDSSNQSTQLVSNTTTTGTFQMPDADVNCTLTNTRIKHNVTLKKTVLPSGDGGTFSLTITDNTADGIGSITSPSPVPDGGTVTLQVYGGSSVTVSEPAPANYTAMLVCGTLASGTNSASFTMPNADVSCSLTNTRNKHTVTLTKSVAPSTDGGTFALSISGCATTSIGSAPQPNPTMGTEGNGGFINCDVTGGLQVTVGETGNSNYTASLSCPGTNLPSGSTTSGTFTMLDTNVTCTLTNTANLATLTIHKVCAPVTDTTSSFTVSVANSTAAPPVAVLCGGKTDVSSLEPGTYTVTETSLGSYLGIYPYVQPSTVNGSIGTTGWAAPGAFSGDCSATGTVTLTYGDHKHCYILNVSNVCTPAFSFPPTSAMTPMPAVVAPKHPTPGVSPAQRSTPLRTPAPRTVPKKN